MRRPVLPLLLVVTALACGPDEASESEVVRTGVGEGSPARSVEEAPPRNGPAVVFLGTSLTAGLGLLRHSETYPERIQEKIDSAGMDFRVVNAGVSGETTAGGLARIDWVLRDSVRVLVLELGANDGLRGQSVDALRDNLQAIVDRTRERYPDVEIVIAGMRAPPNLGQRYTDRFHAVFRELARENDAALIPFLLDGVAGVPSLNQEDRIHPNAEGQRVVAENVWEVLLPVLREVEAEEASVGAS